MIGNYERLLTNSLGKVYVKMEKEFNLSEWIALANYWGKEVDVIPTYKVKEFVRRLKEFIKEEFPTWNVPINFKIDKLAGAKLVE